MEIESVRGVLAKIRKAGAPLAEFAGITPRRGIKTGLDRAFLLDTPAKERLIQTDPACAAIIRPYLRGRDMARWAPNWAELWLIAIASSDGHAWPWSESGAGAEHVFAQTYPSLFAHLQPWTERLRGRQGCGRYWWELRSGDDQGIFDRPKICYPDSAREGRFSLDTDGCLAGNAVHFLASGSLWLLAVLNSLVLSAFRSQEAADDQNGALRLSGRFVERIPIALPSDAIHAEAKSTVERLIAITRESQSHHRSMLDWLCLEIGVESVGRLQNFAALESDVFIDEVRRRRLKPAGPLTPTIEHALYSAYLDLAMPIRMLDAEVQQLERRLSEVINAAYGLTPEEVELLSSTIRTNATA